MSMVYYTTYRIGEPVTWTAIFETTTRSHYEHADEFSRYLQSQGYMVTKQSEGTVLVVNEDEDGEYRREEHPAALWLVRYAGPRDGQPEPQRFGEEPRAPVQLLVWTDYAETWDFLLDGDDDDLSMGDAIQIESYADFVRWLMDKRGLSVVQSAGVPFTETDLLALAKDYVLHVERA